MGDKLRKPTSDSPNDRLFEVVERGLTLLERLTVALEKLAASPLGHPSQYPQAAVIEDNRIEDNEMIRAREQVQGKNERRDEEIIPAFHVGQVDGLGDDS